MVELERELVVSFIVHQNLFEMSFGLIKFILYASGGAGVGGGFGGGFNMGGKGFH